MIDHELEEILRTRFRRDGARAGAAPAALYASVSSIPETTPFGVARYPTRRVLLLAATILLTLTVGGALAIGSGLIRLPRPPDFLPGPPADELSTVLLQPLACDLTLGDELVLQMRFNDPTGKPAQVTVDEDGHVVRGPEPWLPEEGIPWEQRTMSAEGLARLLADVEGSGLRDCMQVPGPGPTAVSVRLEDEIVVMGFGGWSVRKPSQAELDAGNVLAGRFIDVDLGVEADEWVDAEWLPYEPDRAQIILLRFEGSVPCCWTSGDYQDVAWQDMTLPDGSTFRTVGATHPDDPPPDYLETRCHVIPAVERDAWIEAFGEPADPAHLWMLADGSNGGGLQITMTPLLPHDPGCLGSPDQPPREKLIDDLRVCDLVPESAGWGDGFLLEDHGGGWGACEYYPPRSRIGGWVFASRHAVTAEEAPAVAAHQFGYGLTTDEVAGRPVYLNSCIEPTKDCSAAIAISADPYFVIVVPDRHSSPDELRALAESVIGALTP